MALNGLMVHAGGNHVTLDELYHTPTPNSTATWTPIPHTTLLELTLETLERDGYSVIDEAHAISRQGANYFGLLNLKSDFRDHTTTVGLRNSHSQQFPAGIAVGNMVFVCDNLAFSGEITFKRRHTTHINRDLPMLISNTLGQLDYYETAQEQRILDYKTTELTSKDADHAIMSALRALVIPSSKVKDVIDEFLNPRHPEFSKDGMTVWRLYNSVTEFMKNSLWNLPKRTMALHTILDSFCKPVIEYDTASI